MLTTPPAAPLARTVPDLPPVRAGNVPDAKALRTRLQTLLMGLERADEVLLRLVAQAQAHCIFMVLEDEHGTFFRDWTSFCTAPIPWGLGINQALIDELAREHRDPAAGPDGPGRPPDPALPGRAARPRPYPALAWRATPGRPRPAAPNPTPRAPGTVEYQLQRLKRDHPEILQQLAEGKIRSVAAAAELAGPPHQAAGAQDPDGHGQGHRLRVPAGGRRGDRGAVTHPEKIPAPPGPRNWLEALRGQRAPASTPPTPATAERPERRPCGAVGARCGRQGLPLHPRGVDLPAPPSRRPWPP